MTPDENFIENDFERVPRVLSLKPIRNGCSLKATADVEINTGLGPITLCDCALFEKPNDQTGLPELSVGPPSKPNPLPGSMKKYMPVVRWHPDVRRAVTDAVSQAYRDFPSGFGEKAPSTFRGEVRNRANLPPERPAPRGNGYQGSGYNQYGNGRNGGQR